MADMNRQRWPRMVSLVIGAALIPVAVVLAVAQAKHPFATETFLHPSGIDVAAGSELFEVHCFVCHDTRPEAAARGGPNLFEIGKNAATRRAGLTAAQYLLESIVDPAAFHAPNSTAVMPQNVADSLSPANLRNLVGFLARQGATPNYREIANLPVSHVRRNPEPPRELKLAQLELGESVFRGQSGCSNCHQIEPDPGLKMLLAPTLNAAAKQDLAYLHQAIVDPSASISGGFTQTTVALTSGLNITGRLVRRTPTELRILTTDSVGHATVQTVRLADVEQGDDGTPMIRESKVSPMPQGFGQSLRPDEIDAVVNFIKSLN